MTTQPAERSTRRLLWLVFWISASVLGFEIALMRVLLVASWHHFAFLVISIALLGFGASGTVLTLARSFVMRHSDGVLFVVALFTAVAVPVSTALAQHVPIEARFVPTLLWKQLGLWSLYWLLLAIPFFLGAAVIGASLMVTRDKIATVYGSNLLGSAVGAITAPLVMNMVLPEWLPAVFSIPAWIGAAAFLSRPHVSRWAAWLISVAAVAVVLLFDQPQIRIDPYKYVAYVHRLVHQGQAEPVAGYYGPRAVVEAYRSDALHDLPFLSVGENPPALTAIVIDGHWAGSVFDISRADEAEVMDRALMAFPYVFAPSHPRVALLGEMGGTNIWLSIRREASVIDVVQPHGDLVRLLSGPLKQRGGGVLDLPHVNMIVAEPRHHVEHAEDEYDLIQIVSLESLAAGSGGIGGLGQDFLVTVQGIAACLRRLSDDGILTVSRGIQFPPRDNLKLLATLIEGLRGLGVEQPERHIVIVRDYLAVCTIVRKAPWSPDEIRQLRAACRAWPLTPVWFDGIRAVELNQPDALPSPPDGIGDWYHFAAKELFSPRAQRFIDEWVFDIRPPTDHRPFFLDFCRVKSIGVLRDAFGDLWLTRAELAYLFVLAATGFIAAIGALLTLLPLIFLRSARQSPGRTATIIYFSAIGLAYLLLEMTFLSRLTLWIGDPVVSAAVVIGGFLVLSGAGSLTAQRVRHRPGRVIGFVVGGLVVLGAAGLLFMPLGDQVVGSQSEFVRCVWAMVTVAPLGILMGFPMPMALRQLDAGAPALLPWAWGVNGFGSVMAAPLAMVVGMWGGFHIVAGTALGLYLVAAGTFHRLAGAHDSPPSQPNE